MPIEIRAATRADRERVLALLGAQLGEHTIRPPDDALARAVDRILDGPEFGRLFVAVRDGAIVGLAGLTFGWSFEHGGRSAWLDEVYVEPAERGGGIGAALVRAACDAAACEGAHALDLEVEAGHERAARLYERLGFEPHQRQRWMRRLQPAGPVSPATDTEYTGGCLCGSVRYRAIGAPFDVSHCHCSLCRRSTGAPFVTWATFPINAFAFTRGTAHARASTPQAVRSFCAQCGTALTFRETARPNSIDIAAGSLDAPQLLRPLDHTYTASMLPWLRFADTLPRYEHVNPSEVDCPADDARR